MRNIFYKFTRKISPQLGFEPGTFSYRRLRYFFSFLKKLILVFQAREKRLNLINDLNETIN